MNEFTKGEWSIKFRNNNEIQTTFIGVVIGHEYIDLGFFNNEEDKANAVLIATAGTTATKLAKQGYDAVKVLELLPDLVHSIEIRDWYQMTMLIDKCLGE